MRVEREYIDGNGKKFRAVLDIDEGPLLALAMHDLANKARNSPKQRASALRGAVHVVVHPVKEP